jgi:signal transduction histidine kinase
MITERGRLDLAGPTVRDGLTAAALTALALFGVVAGLDVEVIDASQSDEALVAIDALGIGLMLLQTGPLVFRRKLPVWTLAVTAGGLIAFSLLRYHPSLASFGFLIAIYSVSAYRPRRMSVPAGLASAGAVLMMLLLGPEPLSADALGVNYLLGGAAWFIGDSVRLRRGHMVELEDKALRLEQERAERVKQAVAEERQVIARELHDVVAHNVSVMVAQAGAAQRIFEAQPEEALGALGAIEHSGREALVEMRRLTGFLRTEHDHADGRSPQPGLHSLEALVAQVEEAGLPVRLTIDGAPRPLPVGLDLSAFRIVQEALTNTLKHAGPATAEVVVRYGERRLDLTITDDGAQVAHPDGNGSRPGYGQLGMRERVALFGGELRVGPKRDGGYVVRASLPMDGGPS